MDTRAKSQLTNRKKFRCWTVNMECINVLDGKELSGCSCAFVCAACFYAAFFSMQFDMQYNPNIGCNRKTCFPPKIEIESHQILYPVDKSVHKMDTRQRELPLWINANSLCMCVFWNEVDTTNFVNKIYSDFIYSNQLWDFEYFVYIYYCDYLHFRNSNIFCFRLCNFSLKNASQIYHIFFFWWF